MKREAEQSMRLCGCLFLIVFTLSGCRIVSDMSESENDSDSPPSQSIFESVDADAANYDKQLRLIADHAEIWMGDTEGITEPCFYAVTDLDQNGRLEIIQSSCQGTGRYSYSQWWEISPDGTELVPCRLEIAEGDSQPDIITDPAGVFFDETKNRYDYLFYDDLRIGAAEYVQSRVALSLKDGVITAALLGQMHIMDTNADGNTQTDYTDADGNAIDEEAYNTAEEKVFADWKAMEAAIGWTDDTVSAQLPALNAEEIMDLLKASWEGFSLR